MSAEPRRSRGDDGRGDLAESPEPKGGNAPKVVGQIETPRPPDPILRRPRADREEKRVTYGNGLRPEERLDPNNPNQRRLLALAGIMMPLGLVSAVEMAILWGDDDGRLGRETSTRVSHGSI